MKNKREINRLNKNINVANEKLNTITPVSFLSRFNALPKRNIKTIFSDKTKIVKAKNNLNSTLLGEKAIKKIDIS